MLSGRAQISQKSSACKGLTSFQKKLQTPKIPNFTAWPWLSEQQSDDMRAEVNYRVRPPRCMLSLSL